MSASICCEIWTAWRVLEPRQDLHQSPQKCVAGDEQEKQHQHGREQAACDRTGCVEHPLVQPAALNRDGCNGRPSSLRKVLGLVQEFLERLDWFAQNGEALLQPRK